MHVGLAHARLHLHPGDVRQDHERLVRPDLVPHLGLALLRAEEDVLVDDDAGHLGAHLAARQLLLRELEPRRGLLDPALRRGDRRLLLGHAVGARALELAQRLAARLRVRAGLAELERPAEAEQRVAAPLGELQLLARARDLLLRALELSPRDEAFGEQRAQVLERGLRLLQVALRVRHCLGDLVLLDAALALLHVLQLEVALLDAQLRRQHLLAVLQPLQLQVLARLRELRLGLPEQRLVAPDLLLEGRGVEQDQQVALLHGLPFRCHGRDLGLVALDRGGVGHRAHRLERAGLRDRDPERPLAHDGTRLVGAAARERPPEHEQQQERSGQRRDGAARVGAQPRPGATGEALDPGKRTQRGACDRLGRGRGGFGHGANSVSTSSVPVVRLRSSRATA